MTSLEIFENDERDVINSEDEGNDESVLENNSQNEEEISETECGEDEKKHSNKKFEKK